MSEARVPLSELIVALQRGQSYKGLLVGEPGPFLLGLGTIQRNGGFRSDSLRTYGGETPKSIMLESGDLYVSLKDMTHAADLLGAVARVPDGLGSARLTQDTIRLGVDESKVVTDFLYWSLRTAMYRAHCRSRGTGTTNLDLSRADFLAYEVYLPSRHEQRGIAEVLGALDDKIAANTKLTGTSLLLADAVFERTSRGLALRSATFDEAASIQGGGTPSTKIEEYWGGEVLWATPTDVTNLGAPYLERTARQITKAGFEACSSALHPTGSILMTSRATIGAFAIAQSPVAVNQGFIVVNATDPSLQWWLFHEMRSRVPEFLSHANGATFLELSRGLFKKLTLRLPDDAVAFHTDVEPLHRRARAAALESEWLAKTRDVLLPLLMSGKIRVKDAERVVEGVV